MALLKPCLFTILILHFLLTFFHVAANQSAGFSLKLIPWDSPKSPFYQPNLTQTQKVHMMVMSSKPRPISSALKNETFYSNMIQLPMEHHGLRYSVNIRIGKPSKEVTLLLDTGSGFIWTRCNQSPSDFNRNKSLTYRTLPCQHPMCPKGNDSPCKCINRQCVCTLNYGTHGRSNQVIASFGSDSFTLPIRSNRMMTFSNMIFGCSDWSPVYSGILGIDKLPISLISQVRNTVQGRYSYCLSEGSGYLKFGDNIPKLGKDAKTTNILYPLHSSMLLELTDISVAHKRLRLSPHLFSYQEGGFLIDSGTPLTVLKKQAYDKVIQEFANYYQHRLERVRGQMYGLDLCYRRNLSMRSYASMTFHLRGADYTTRNLYVFPTNGIMCIGLVSATEASILGAYQQRNTRFIFDINNNQLEFASEDCSKDRR